MLEIRPFDPDAASRDEWTEFHLHRRVRAEEDEPGEPILTDAEFEHDLRRRWPFSENRRLVAWGQGRIVGNITLNFRREDTPDYAAFAPFLQVWGGVRESWRRQGVATALLRPVLAFMQDRGKTTLTLSTHLPEGRGFLAAIGAVEKHRNVVNRLALAGLDWHALARWQQAAIPPGSGLTWEIHAGRVPLARLAVLHPQFTTLLRDVPLAALDLPPPRYEMEGYIGWYEEMDRRGGEHFVVLLMDGENVAGICEAHWSGRFPDRVYQELTGVARLWRGRGLAKGLKAAMLRLVHERRPEVRLMTTGNAEGNDAILSINRRLGFVEYRVDSSYQVGRDGLESWLATRAPVIPANASFSRG